MVPFQKSTGSLWEIRLIKDVNYYLKPAGILSERDDLLRRNGLGFRFIRYYCIILSQRRFYGLFRQLLPVNTGSVRRGARGGIK
jgi:hypothetical protein